MTEKDLYHGRWYVEYAENRRTTSAVVLASSADEARTAFQAEFPGVKIRTLKPYGHELQLAAQERDLRYAKSDRAKLDVLLNEIMGVMRRRPHHQQAAVIPDVTRLRRAVYTYVV